MTTVTIGQAETNIQRLKRFQSFEIQTVRLLGAWLPGIRRWEAKHMVGRHLWEDAQHSQELRTRLWELRVSDPDRDVDEQVRSVVHALAHAQHDYELIAGVYLVLKRALLSAYEQYVDATHAVYDAPSLPMFKTMVAEKEAQVAWAETAVDDLADTEEKQRRVQRWTRYAQDVLDAAGGVAGGGPSSDEALPDPPPGYSSVLPPFPEAKRDERFDVRIAPDAPPDEDDRDGQVLWQFMNYGQEMQAAETLGGILWEVDDMDWEFYYDLARHCWDEVRHSQLGESRLNDLNYDITDFPQYVGNYAWRQLIDPMRRYCVLTHVIEAGSFKYKHRTYQEHIQHDDVESAQAVLYDIMDETMHVRLGHKWVPALMEHYGYDKSEEELVEECRVITEKHTLSPEQKQAASANG